MTARNTKRAVFLDRDGCISPDEFGYLAQPERYHLYPWTGEALRLLKQLGYLLFVITNQSGVARGYFDITTLERVLDRMRYLLEVESVTSDGVYYSPYFATGIVPPYNVRHEDRKPGLGMFRKALQEHPFDPGRSWMLGDRKTDIEFGKKAGMKAILLLSGNGTQEMASPDFVGWDYKPDFIAENLLTATRIIEIQEQ
jgi:D-glycero-D-manno-heptose 1,7-bisphosphate phosphatase